LRDVLFSEGVEFPCGGRGRCRGCKIKLLSGSLPITADETARLSARELEQGYRLACCGCAESDLRIELAQWVSPILVDDSAFDFKPVMGLGVAVDLGTTTLAAQLLDLENGRTLAVRTALNAQAAHGTDIMSRIEFCVSADGQPTLQNLIRQQLGKLIGELIFDVGRSRTLNRVAVVGNTVMHHVFCGLDVEPLSTFPFEPANPGLQCLSCNDLNWELPGDPTVWFLPCLGGFVGSDILAGILATGLHKASSLNALIDLGTNGELVVGNRDRLLCASTAAGPAFEGARISMGMRASTGAISEVRVQENQLQCHVLGGGPPRGICGSGLVDAVAAGLDLGRIHPSGRFTRVEDFVLLPPVTLNQRDIRELQLAKGAIAAGLRILLKQWGATAQDLEQVYLAGAFGNYVNQASARKIGLLDVPAESIRAAGNTALLGAKLSLFDLEQSDGLYAGILRATRHVSLNEDTSFQDVYAEQMAFP
jgi:uncharacterized 2Fe-2S/4Fe-4S cluster protein (DUF4445 family)